MSIISRLATVDAFLYRNPPASGGRVGSPTLVTALKIVPILPYEYEIPVKVMYDNKAAIDRYVTYVEAPADIRNGDMLLVGDTRYIVRNPGEWDTTGNSTMDYVELVLDLVREKLQGD